MKLSDFVVPEAILPSVKAESKEGAVRAMVDSLKNCDSIHPDHVDGIIAAGAVMGELIAFKFDHHGYGQSVLQPGTAGDVNLGTGQDIERAVMGCAVHIRVT